DATNATDKRCYVTLRGTLRTQRYITHRKSWQSCDKIEAKARPIDGRVATNSRPATAKTQMKSEVVIVHSSDLHVDHDYTARIHGGDGTAGPPPPLSPPPGPRAPPGRLPPGSFARKSPPPGLSPRPPPP